MIDRDDDINTRRLGFGFWARLSVSAIGTLLVIAASLTAFVWFAAVLVALFRDALS